jgi:hypothetical protein
MSANDPKRTLLGTPRLSARSLADAVLVAEVEEHGGRTPRFGKLPRDISEERTSWALSSLEFAGLKRVAPDRRIVILFMGVEQGGRAGG